MITMPRISITVPDELDEYLNQQSSESGDFDSKSEMVRESIRSMKDGDDGVDELERELEEQQSHYEDEIDKLETVVERLENEKRTILSQREENQELVKWAKEEQSLQRRREERQTAPVWKRAKWWLTGYDG
ncbi:ribbon-helix-helix domain-containing protein [Haladaptatus pallidirubidus]|nr:ribbon-helix-helix domain-containing protein [Haladaptatus pallidirubidus]